MGYVQLKQQQSHCELKARITPEHKIKAKNYNVSCIINNDEKTVLEAKCHDCPASEGGFKHAVAFLMWLHRRREEPSPTEKICYWKRSVLSAASNTKKFISTTDFGKTKFLGDYNDSLVREYIHEAKKRRIENSLMRYHNPQKYSRLSIHYLAINLKKSELPQNSQNFLKFCKLQMDEKLILDVEKDTRYQCNSMIWQEMRYGRITASKAYEVIRCKTLDGCLVENILGAKIFQSSAMSRGLKLETDVLKVLSKETSIKFSKAGIFLSKDFPLMGASPDALNDDFVVEIKSPSSEKTSLNYIDSDGNIKPKCLYQLQMQMCLAQKRKGIFVVAHPNFEATKQITIKYCDYDSTLVHKILNEINHFWFENIYNKVL